MSYLVGEIMTYINFTVVATNLPSNIYSIDTTCPLFIILNEFCKNYNIIYKDMMLLWDDKELNLSLTPDYYQIPNNAIFFVVPR